MIYKLLNQKGLSFLCLEDGTKIPGQVSTAIQIQREKCRATVVAYCDERMGAHVDPKLRFNAGVLSYGKHILSDIEDVVINAGVGEHMDSVTFSVYCELPDTIEQPKPYEV